MMVGLIFPHLYISELFSSTNSSEIFRYFIRLAWWNQFGFILSYPAIFHILLIHRKISLDHFWSIHFRFLSVLDRLFLNFIVRIFSTVVGYILIIGGSLPEIELFSHIVFECVLNSFRCHNLPNQSFMYPALLPVIYIITFFGIFLSGNNFPKILTLFISLSIFGV